MIFTICLVITILAVGVGMFLHAVEDVLVYIGLGVGIVGMIASGIAFAATPVTAATETYALRPLTAVGAANPAYLSTAAGSTSYAYDDNGATRTGSTTSEQTVEVRQDGGSDPRVEIIRHERRNGLLVPDAVSLDESIVFHIPAGSPLTR